MNKTELTDAVAARTGQTKATIAALLDGVLATVKDTRAEAEALQLIGFGSFKVSERPEREGSNPATGATIKINAKKIVRFKPGKDLAEAVAGK